MPSFSVIIVSKPIPLLIVNRRARKREGQRKERKGKSKVETSKGRRSAILLWVSVLSFPILFYFFFVLGNSLIRKTYQIRKVKCLRRTP